MSSELERDAAELFEGLTAIQARAVLMLGDGVKPRHVREKLEVPKTTWWRWQHSAQFQAAISRVHSWVLRDARARFVQLTDPALDIYEMAMDKDAWTVGESGAKNGIPATAFAAAKDTLERNGITAPEGLEAGSDGPKPGNVYSKLGDWAETHTASTGNADDDGEGKE